MNIEKERHDDKLTLTLTGRLDTNTASELEHVIQESDAEIKTLMLDLAGLDYISSAGLRVILTAQKKMLKQGSMKLRNLTESVREVFDMTGFSTILDIE